MTPRDRKDLDAFDPRFDAGALWLAATT